MRWEPLITPAPIPFEQTTVADIARTAGLTELYVENLAAAREPSTMDGVARLLTDGDTSHVPIKLCLDVGHQCVPGTTGAERDPVTVLRHRASKL